MDDITYDKLDSNRITCQISYIAKKRLGVPDQYILQICELSGNLLIWPAIWSCVALRNDAFVTTPNVTSNLYIKKWLEECLLPLIRQHKSPVKFWPGFTSYKVAVISKDKNLIYAAELRPKENFGGSLSVCPRQLLGQFETKSIYWKVELRAFPKLNGRLCAQWWATSELKFLSSSE